MAKRTSARMLALIALLAALAVPALATAQDKGVDEATKKIMAAQGLYQRELFQLAAKEYREYLKEHPKHEHRRLAQYGLSLCHYRLGEYAEAGEILAGLVKDNDFDHREGALAVLGHCYMQTRDYDKAQNAFETLLKKYPKSDHAEAARLNRAQALYLRKEYKASLEACREFLKDYRKSPSRPAAEYFRGISLMALGEHAKAADAFRGLLKDHSKSSYAQDARLNLGRSLEAVGKLKDAIDAYTAFLKTAPKERTAEGRYALGVALHKAGEHGRAIGELGTVVSKHSETPFADPARLQLGIARLDAGKTDDARKTFQDVVKKDKTRATRARYYLARCDMVDGKYDDARKTLSELVKQNPAPKNLDEIYYQRTLCAMHLEDFKQAAEEFEQFGKKWPDAVEVTDSMYRRAYCLYRLKEYDKSLQLCREVAKRPTSSVTVPALELAAENLFLKENYTDAAKTLEPLLEKTEDKARIAKLVLRIGQCRYYAGDYKQAIDRLKPLTESEALGQTPAMWEGVLLLGDSQLKADQPEAAVATLKKYLTRDTKKQAEARFKLALAQVAAKQRDDARSTLADLVKADGNNPWVQRGRLQYAQLLYDQDKLKDAAEQLDALLKTDPDKELKAPAMYLAAYIDMQQERYSAAAERFGKLVGGFPDYERTPEALFQRGVCLRNEGKFDDARKLLESYLKDHPRGEHAGRARYLVGVCLASQDKHKDAIKIFADLAGDKDTVSDAVLYKLAWSSREIKDTKTAKAAYRSLLKDYPEGPFATHARAELAGMLYVEKEYAEAADLLEKVVGLEKTPEDILPVSLYRLGSCYEKLGKPGKTAEVLEAFKKRFTDHELAPSALYKAAVALLTEEKPAEAADLLETLLKRFEKHDLATPALMKLGEAQATAGKYDDAYKTYLSFVKKYPKYDMLYFAQFGAGWSAENLKKYDTAREWYKKVIKVHNGETAARAQFQVGQCYLKEGKYEPAAGELLKVEIVYDYPKWSSRALYEAGMTFERDKKYTQARKQYERCVKLFPKSTPAELSAKRLEALKKAGY